MSLSKARDRTRKRIERAKRSGKPVQLRPTDAITILPQDERKDILAKIAQHTIEKPVTAGHKIAAIKELNLMEHVYDPNPQGGTQIITIFVSKPEDKLLIQSTNKRFMVTEAASPEDIEGEASTPAESIYNEGE